MLDVTKTVKDLLQFWAAPFYFMPTWTAILYIVDSLKLDLKFNRAPVKLISVIILNCDDILRITTLGLVQVILEKYTSDQNQFNFKL